MGEGGAQLLLLLVAAMLQSLLVDSFYSLLFQLIPIQLLSWQLFHRLSFIFLFGLNFVYQQILVLFK